MNPPKENQGIRPRVWMAVLGFLAVLGVVVAFVGGKRAPHAPKGAASTAAPGAAGSTGSAATASANARSRASRDGGSTVHEEAKEAPEYIEGMVWGDIDLREARAAMPDNLYWSMAAPTKDEEILKAREQEKERRDQQYGRVLSGDASEDEVKDYYDWRRRVSSDFLEFADFMSRSYADGSNEELKGMLALAVKLHTARLAQIDSDLAAALARAQEHARIREEWQREQAEFHTRPASPPADGN